MNYHLKSNHRQSFFSRPAGVTLLILLCAGILALIAPAFIANTTNAIVRPFLMGGNSTLNWLHTIPMFFTEKLKLQQQNDTLQSQIDEAQVALLTLDSYKKENTELKALLGRKSTETRILANVLARPNRTAYDTLLLDVGSAENIHVGDKIVAGDFIIGTIAETSTNSSKAILLSSSGQVLPVIIGDSHVEADAYGRGNGNFMIKLPKEIAVKKGDMIRQQELNQKFVGVVEAIELKDTDSFQFILFKLPINTLTLPWVEIIKQK